MALTKVLSDDTNVFFLSELPFYLRSVERCEMFWAHLSLYMLTFNSEFEV